MKTLYAQTDTTGRFNFREPITYTEQPNMVRLACVIAEDAEIIGSWCVLIRPNNTWVVEDDAVVAHGVTLEDGLERGVPVEQAMARFVGWLDDVGRVCAFNVDFHRKVLERAAFQSRLGWAHLFDGKTMACAMRRATDIVRIPRMAPGGGLSWPKLRDAYEFFSDGEELPSPDLDPIERGIALARCVYLIDRGIIEYNAGVSHQ
jgi:hypothetical protein